MKAVFETGGKQYRVALNDEIFVEKIEAEAGDKVSFNKVLLIDSKAGNPYIKNAKVEAEVIKHGKDKKIRIFRYVPKNRSSRRTMGHRQPYTKLKITNIVGA